MTAKVAAHNAEETKEPTPSLKTITRMKSFAQRARKSNPGMLRRQMSQRIVAYREASERTKVLKAKERLAKSKAAIDHAGGLLADADDLYFSTLKLHWPALLLHVLAAYTAIVLVSTIVNLLCARGLGFDGTGTWWTAIMYACANVVTMGYGEVNVSTKGAYFAGIVQMALGLMLNVVCFAVVVSKFQQPRSRLVFASHFCVTKRDGKRVLLIRLANRRCNLILHPEIRVLFLTPHATREGESYIGQNELQLETVSSAMTGVLTVSHVIDEKSPLGKYVKNDAFDREAFCDESNALSVTVLGRDTVYHDDLMCKHTYLCAKDAIFDQHFSWMTRRDENGKVVLDFHRLDDTEAAASTAAPVAAPPNVPPPALHFDDIDVHVFCGGLKLGDRLRPNCVFSENAYAACEAKGLRVKRHFIDLAAKPQWFLDLVSDYGAKAETPCVLLPGGEFVTDTAKVLARLAPYDGVGVAVEPADVSPGMLMSWFAYQASVPVTVRDLQNAEKWAASRLKLDKFVDKIRPLEAYLDGRDYLSDGATIGWSDLRYIFLVGFVDMFSRVCDPEGAAYVQSQCPRVAAWVERCAKDPVVLKARCGLDFDPRRPANCAAMQKMVGKYFKHQVDLLPSFVDEVLAPYDAFAAGAAPLLAFEDVDVHLFAGGLRLGDKLVESCIFSDNVYAACIQAGWKLRRHWIDLEDKPQWFLDLVEKNGAKAETPCALIKKADGSAEFVIDTTKLLERLAPSTGEGFPVADADVMPGLMMPWFLSVWNRFGYQASLPVLVRDVRDAAKAAAKEEKMNAFIERLKLLDAYLQDHDYLSGGSAPGWSDWRFIFLAGITVMMTRQFDKPGASKLEEQCPKVIAWIARMTRDPIFLRTREGVAYDPRAPQNALSMRHLVHKYFKHQTDLVPAFVDEVLAPFDAAAAAAKQKAAAPATTGDAIAQSGLAKKELATFCL